MRTETATLRGIKTRKSTQQVAPVLLLLRLFILVSQLQAVLHNIANKTKL